MIIDIEAELAALAPLDVDRSTPDRSASDAGQPTMGAAVGKLARQQFRANQQSEHALSLLEAQCARVAESADHHRREAVRLRDDARDTRLRIVEAIDALDDLLIVATQRNDPFWTDRLQRAGGRFTAALAAVGVTELPTVGHPFDTELHEVVDTMPSPTAAESGVVCAVVRRGYRDDGRVLRRAQVITNF